MANHHVELPEQVVSPGEELWVKIIEIDLQRRRISLSIKQAAEGGEVAAEYREAFGEHAYDEQGNYIGAAGFADFEPESEAQAAWAEYLESGGSALASGEEAGGAEEGSALESAGLEGAGPEDPGPVSAGTESSGLEDIGAESDAAADDAGGFDSGH